MGQFIDYTGQRFGRLTVIKRIGTRERGIKTKIKIPLWLCECDCGNKTIATSAELRTGDAKSCGCLSIEMLTNRSRTHGDSSKNSQYHRLFRIWRHMKERCEDIKNSSYPEYGGRGISLCEEWHNYESFKEWALNNGYNDDLTIDRINNDGNYEPSNCRWADFATQANNKRSTRKIEIDGETRSITEWCKEYGTNPYTAYSRIDLFGWDPEKAVKTKPRQEKHVRMICKDGSIKEFESANEAAKVMRLNANGIRSACEGAQKTHAGYVWEYFK